MVASRSTATKPAATSKVAEDEIDLLAGMDTSNTSIVEEDEDFDLLSDMSESDASAWIPWDDEDTPKAIQGKVLHIGVVQADARYGGHDVPYWEVQDKNDSEKVWGVRGYSTVLSNQMTREQDADLRNGDFVAVVFKGIQQNRSKTNEYKNFQIKSKHIGH